MPKISCPKLGRVIELDPHKSLMRNLLDQHIPVGSTCGGDAICGKCRMKIQSSDELTPAGDLEKKVLAKNNAQSDERLSCQIYLTNDAEVDTTYW